MTANGLALVCVFDGLRPDMVRPDWTPHLDRLRQRGVWFARSHCVFPSATRINASSLVTGSFPGAHGIPGNTLWRPDVIPERRLQTGDAADLRRMQAAQGRMLALPTLGETLAAAGARTVAVGTGSSGAAYLLHPEASHTDGLLYHHDFTEPPALAAQVAAALGAPPSAGDLGALAAARVEYGARALTDVLIPRANPAAALFWLTIPDGPHHAYGIGAPESVAAIRAADASFGAMLERLAAQGLADNLTLFVTSDHGYITVTDNIDMEAALIAAGLKRSADSPELTLCTDGGTCHLYSDGSADLGAVAAFLLAQPWTAAVFSRAPLPGTLPLAAVGHDGPRAPDLIVALAWDDGENVHGLAGRSLGQGEIAAGSGSHGGISTHEMRNTLIAAGPRLRQGSVSEIPCGIVDIAPTLLHCVGLPAPEDWQGRVLGEALREGGAAPVWSLDQRTADFAGGRQELSLAHTGGVTYTAGARIQRG